MRISENVKMDVISTTKTAVNTVPLKDVVVTQGSNTIGNTSRHIVEQPKQIQPLDNSEDTKAKVQEAVNKLNDMLKINNSASKFKYHDGLERYYVTVVDSQTDEVVKEIPSRKLLDAYYEMQKMLGMIVDEKI